MDRPPRALIVCDTRGEAARRVALALAAELRCTVDALDQEPRPRMSGIFTKFRDALRRDSSQPPPATAAQRSGRTLGEHNPSDYDIVIVGTHVRGAKVSPLIREYLEQHAPKLSSVAFFCTSRSAASALALRELERLAGRTPVAVLDLRTWQLAADRSVPAPWFAEAILRGFREHERVAYHQHRYSGPPRDMGDMSDRGVDDVEPALKSVSGVLSSST